jgi:hypothetical protein
MFKNCYSLQIAQSDWRLFRGLLAFKIGYIGLIFVLSLFRSNHYNQGRSDLIKRYWFVDEASTWLQERESNGNQSFMTWDAAHYLVLSEFGYGKEVKSSAFYPLWPFFIRSFSTLIGGNKILAGVILANVFSLIAWGMFYRATAERYGRGAANWALTVLILFPGSLFFQFIYSESLFFLLTMLVLHGLEHGAFRLAWVAAFLLPLTKAIGVFTVLPLIWYCFFYSAKPMQIHEETGVFHPTCIATKIYDSLKRANSPFLIMAPLMGWLTYLLLMWLWTEDPLGGIQAQRYWQVHSIWNLVNFPNFVIGYFEVSSWHDFRGSLLDRCGFLLLLCFLGRIWRLGGDLFVWTYLLGIIPAMSGSLVSFIRYEGIVFPLFAALGVYLAGMRSRIPGVAIVLMFSIVHGILLWRFVNYSWAG